MDYTDLVIGLTMTVLGTSIIVLQLRNEAFKRPINNGVVHVTFGGIFLIATGVYLIISSFK